MTITTALAIVAVSWFVVAVGLAVWAVKLWRDRRDGRIAVRNLLDLLKEKPRENEVIVRLNMDATEALKAFNEVENILDSFRPISESLVPETSAGVTVSATAGASMPEPPQGCVSWSEFLCDSAQAMEGGEPTRWDIPAELLRLGAHLAPPIYWQPNGPEPDREPFINPPGFGACPGRDSAQDAVPPQPVAQDNAGTVDAGEESREREIGAQTARVRVTDQGSTSPVSVEGTGGMVTASEADPLSTQEAKMLRLNIAMRHKLDPAYLCQRRVSGSGHPILIHLETGRRWIVGPSGESEINPVVPMPKPPKNVDVPRWNPTKPEPETGDGARLGAREGYSDGMRHPADWTEAP